MTTEPLRTDPSSPTADALPADRDARIEQLLLAGLDQYFAGQYDQAINVWTRVLFFDRGHARARAYIERARRAQAERHRESEELLHTGTVAYRSGDVKEARRLLQAALDSGAPLELAFPMLERLNQLEPMPAVLGPARTAKAVPPMASLEVSGGRREPMSALVVIASIVAAAAVCVAAVVVARSDWPRLTEATTPATPVAHDAVIGVPTRGELALARARRLAAGGALHDALSALDAVRTTDPQRQDADQLRTDIQQQLLRLAHP